MTKEDQERHASLVQRLQERVRGKYAMTMTEVEVRNPQTGEVVGEIDLVGIVDGNWDIYEVKVNDGYRKALKQLRNLRQYLDNCGDINLFYYSGKTRKVRKVE
jgi:hypothetical protein